MRGINHLGMWCYRNIINCSLVTVTLLHHADYFPVTAPYGMFYYLHNELLLEVLLLLLYNIYTAIQNK